jgi:type I restriction enzyme S subunit
MAAEGWAPRRIGDFATRSKLINSDGAHLPPLSITKDRGVVLQSEKYKKQIATDLRKYVIARRGQFAFDPMSLYYGAIGRVASMEVGLVSPDYVVFDVDDTVDRTFLNYLLRSPRQVAEYEAVAETGNSFGKRRRVYWSVLEQMAVNIPPLDEQRKIAAIFSAVDDAIAATQALIDQLQIVKKAMLAELLTRGLPGRHTRFKETELGELPVDWDVVRLEDLCSQVVDCPHSTPRYVDAGFPVIRTADVIPGRILFANAKQVSEETLQERVRRLVPEPGDVFYSREGERLGIAAPVPAGARLCLGQRMMHLRAAGDVEPSFLCWLMNAPVVFEQATGETGGSTSPHVNVGSVRAFVVPRPTRDEQTQIGAAMNAAEERLISEERYLAGLKYTKAALMTLLLSGELRVNVDEASA